MSQYIVLSMATLTILYNGHVEQQGTTGPVQKADYPPKNTKQLSLLSAHILSCIQLQNVQDTVRTHGLK